MSDQAKYWNDPNGIKSHPAYRNRVIGNRKKFGLASQRKGSKAQGNHNNNNANKGQQKRKIRAVRSMEMYAVPLLPVETWWLILDHASNNPFTLQSLRLVTGFFFHTVQLFSRMHNLEKILEHVHPSGEQLEVIETVKQGKSVFLTGEAGCGKTTTLLLILRDLFHRQQTFCLTAPTAAAATLLNGQTLHRWLGLRPSTVTLEDWINSRHRNLLQLRFLLQHIKLLVIDEISMVDAELFQLIHQIMCHVRQVDPETAAPFAGLQVLLSGDFIQLPPIAWMDSQPKTKVTSLPLLRNLRDSFESQVEWITEDPASSPTKPTPPVTPPPPPVSGPKGKGKFCFHTPVWRRLFGGPGLQEQECPGRMFYLSRIFRQSTDHEFLDLLQDLRWGLNLEKVVLRLNRRLVDQSHYAKLLEEGALFVLPTNKQVSQMNEKHFQSLPADAPRRNYLRQIESDYLSQQDAEELFPDSMVPRVLQIKVGARVMITKNHFYDWFDASLGFNLARTTTNVHTIKAKLTPFSGQLINGMTGVVEELVQISDTVFLPLVLLDRNCHTESCSSFSHLRILIRPVTWESIQRIPRVNFSDDPTPGNSSSSFTELITLATASQIPLMLAWACTVHRLQGITAPNVIADLQNSFETGQVYVAVSRAPTLQSFHLTRPITVKAIKVANDAVQFYRDHFPHRVKTLN